MQSMIKKPSGSPAKKDDDGRLIIGPYDSETSWLKDFINKIDEDPASCQSEWADFGEELKDEILEPPDLKTLLSYAQVPVKEFETFINECINKS